MPLQTLRLRATDGNVVGRRRPATRRPADTSCFHISTIRNISTRFQRAPNGVSDRTAGHHRSNAACASAMRYEEFLELWNRLLAESDLRVFGFPRQTLDLGSMD